MREQARRQRLLCDAVEAQGYEVQGYAPTSRATGDLDPRSKSV